LVIKTKKPIHAVLSVAYHPVEGYWSAAPKYGTSVPRATLRVLNTQAAPAKSIHPVLEVDILRFEHNRA